jgi:hypothetical protein
METTVSKLLNIGTGMEYQILGLKSSSIEEFYFLGYNAKLLLAACIVLLSCLLFKPKDRGDIFIRNIG